MLKFPKYSTTYIFVFVLIVSTCSSAPAANKREGKWNTENRDDGWSLDYTVASGPPLVSLSCISGSGSGLAVWDYTPPLAAIGISQMEYAAQGFGVEIASGPIRRFYEFRREVFFKHGSRIAQYAAQFQTDDPLWREFARSGRISLANLSADAESRNDRSRVVQFFRRCERRLPFGRLTGSRMFGEPPEHGGDFAYPFTETSISGPTK